MQPESGIMSVDECLMLYDMFLDEGNSDKKIPLCASNSYGSENQEPETSKKRKNEENGRLERNKRERLRAHQITRLIRQLESVLPNSTVGQRKHQTLQRAIQYIRDVNDRKIQVTQQPIAQSNEEVKYQLLKRQFEESAEAIGFFDLGGCVVEYNNAFGKRFGDVTQLMKLIDSRSGDCAELFDGMAKILDGQVDEFIVGEVSIRKVQLTDTFLKVTPSS